MNSCLHCGGAIIDGEYLKNGGLCDHCVQISVMNKVQCRALMTEDEYLDMFGCVRESQEVMSCC